MEITKDIKDRIQFLVTIQIFFASIVYGFYKSFESSELLSNNNASTWGIGVAFCILNYLLIGLLRDKQEHWGKWIKWSVSLNILLFFVPIIVLISTQHEAISGYWELPFKISLWGTLPMPLLTFLLIGFAVALPSKD
jgi:hypothetical protein